MQGLGQAAEGESPSIMPVADAGPAAFASPAADATPGGGDTTIPLLDAPTAPPANQVGDLPEGVAAPGVSLAGNGAVALEKAQTARQPELQSGQAIAPEADPDVPVQANQASPPLRRRLQPDGRGEANTNRLTDVSHPDEGSQARWLASPRTFAGNSRQSGTEGRSAAMDGSATPPTRPADSATAIPIPAGGSMSDGPEASDGAMHGMRLELRAQPSPEFQTPLSRMPQEATGAGTPKGSATTMRQPAAARNVPPAVWPIDPAEANEGTETDVSLEPNPDPATPGSRIAGDAARAAAYHSDSGSLPESRNRNGYPDTANSQKSTGRLFGGTGNSLSTRPAVVDSTSASAGMPAHAPTEQADSATGDDLPSRLRLVAGHRPAEGQGGSLSPQTSFLSAQGSLSGTPGNPAQGLTGMTQATGRVTLPQHGAEPLLAGRVAEASADLTPATPAPSRSLFIRLPAQLREDVMHLRFLQRGDHIDVRVASPSETSARELREHLPSLLSRLHQAGFATERVASLDAAEGTPDAARRGDGARGARQQGSAQEGSGDQGTPQRGRHEMPPEREALPRRGLAAEHFASLLESSQAAAQIFNRLNISQTREL